MSHDVQGVIRAIARAAGSAPKQGEAVTWRPVVTISRTRGSGGGEIAKEVAKRLGVDVFDKDVLNAIANQAMVDVSLMQNLHEKEATASDAWLYAFIFRKSVTRNDYLHSLVTIIRGIYRMGGVIVGRGGHILLAGEKVLRVRIVGGIDPCAKRVALREHMDLDEAKRDVRLHNRERGRFVWDNFGKRLNDPMTFDLVINTDQLADYSHAADLILKAAEEIGISPLPTAAVH